MKEVKAFDWNKSDNFMFVSNDEDYIHVWKLVGPPHAERQDLRVFAQPFHRLLDLLRIHVLTYLIPSLLRLVGLVLQDDPHVLLSNQFVSNPSVQRHVFACLQAHARRLRLRPRLVASVPEVGHVGQPPASVGLTSGSACRRRLLFCSSYP